MGKTVKARTHYGADSLDITIPTNLVREFGFCSGDVFEVSVEKTNDRIRLIYEQVYQAE